MKDKAGVTAMTLEQKTMLVPARLIYMPPDIVYMMFNCFLGSKPTR